MVIVQDSDVTFRFYRPQATSVFLAGEFNGWNRDNLPLSRSQDGYWTVTLRLAPGEYRFRYLGDGQWFVDYAAFGVTHGPFGLDGVVRVSPASAAQRPAAPGGRRAECRSCPHRVAA